METNNHCCCQNPGLKRGHNKSQATSPAASVSTTATQIGSTDVSGAGKKRKYIPGYANIITPSSDKMRGNFKLPGYEATKLQSLPASPQTLFKKNQLLNMLQDFSKHMYDAILQNGIHLPPSISLGLNSMGNINVLGIHPDQAKIDSLFANNSPLAMQFHQIAFTSRLQQLANLQPDFTNAFYQQPSSIQQITFVQMRAVILNPFQMTIDQQDNTTTPTVDTQASKAETLPYHLLISKSADVSMSAATVTAPVLSPITDSQNQPISEPNKFTIDEPQAPIAAKPQPHSEERQHSDMSNKSSPIPEGHRFTIDDPAPPTIVKAELHHVEKHHHSHEGKLKLTINS